MEKTRDKEMRDKGKENPRKNVFRVSFSMKITLKYSLFSMTRLAITIPMERQSRDAWWNFLDTDSFELKNEMGKNADLKGLNLTAQVVAKRRPG